MVYPNNLKTHKSFYLLVIIQTIYLSQSNDSVVNSSIKVELKLLKIYPPLIS